MRVLVIVEDEPDMRLLVRTHLRMDPRLEIVGEASNAADAMEIARTEEPGLIILDHQIEGDIMGLDAAPALKAVAPNCKIILFTAFDLSAEAKAEPAIDAYLSKTKINELLPLAQALLFLPPV